MKEICRAERFCRAWGGGALRFALTLGLLSAVASAAPRAAKGSRSADAIELTAAHLYNLREITDWEGDRCSADDPVLTVTVLGTARDHAGQRLADSLVLLREGGARLESHRMERLSEDPAERFEQHEAMAASNVVFVCSSYRKQVGSILAELAGACTLTVSSIEGFCLKGGMFELYKRGDRLALKVNLKAAKAAGLVVDPSIFGLPGVQAVEGEVPRHVPNLDPRPAKEGGGE